MCGRERAKERVSASVIGRNLPLRVYLCSFLFLSSSLHVYIHIYIYIYIYIYTYLATPYTVAKEAASRLVSSGTQTFWAIPEQVTVYMYIYTYIYIYTHVCIYTCIYIYTCTYIYTYIYIIYTYIHIYKYYMCICIPLVRIAQHAAEHGEVVYLYVCVYIT